MQNFSQSQSKFGYVYILTPSGIAAKSVLTGRFLQGKMDEYEALKAEIKTLKSKVRGGDSEGTTMKSVHND